MSSPSPIDVVELARLQAAAIPLGTGAEAKVCLKSRFTGATAAALLVPYVLCRIVVEAMPGPTGGSVPGVRERGAGVEQGAVRVSAGRTPSLVWSSSF
jgi:hypothetical protein